MHTLLITHMIIHTYLYWECQLHSLIDVQFPTIVARDLAGKHKASWNSVIGWFITANAKEVHIHKCSVHVNCYVQQQYYLSLYCAAPL